MTEQMYKNLDGQNVGSLIDWKLNPKSADPSSPVAGVPWYNEATGEIKVFDGTNVLTLATTTDIASIGEFKGAHDASGGAVPTAGAGDDISAGDFWRVSVAGTITGIGGADQLEPNDLIYALVDNASSAADFTAIQVNVDDSQFIKQEVVTGVNLTGTAMFTATVGPVGLTTIDSYVVLDSSNKDITMAVEITVNQATPSITIMSLIALTGLEVRFLGK